MIARVSSSSSKSARLLSCRVGIPESRNTESLHFGQFSHNRGGYIGSSSSDRIYQIDIDSSTLALASIKSSLSTRSIGLSVSLSPRAQFSRLQTSRLFSSCSRPKASFTFSLLDSDPAMATWTLPQSPPRWNHTPEEVLSITKQALARNKAVSDKVAALPEAECNFETVCNTSSQHYRQTEYISSTCRFS